MSPSADNPAANDELRVGINAVGAIMGGAARHLPPFLDALRTARPGWALHVWANPQAEVEPAAGTGVTVVPRQSVPVRFGWENRQFVRELEERHVDVVLNLTNSCPLVGDIPYVLYQRNTFWFDPRWLDRLSRRWRTEAAARRWLTYLQGRKATVVIVPSAAMRDALRHWRGWPDHADIRVIPHAVDVDAFPFEQHTWPPPAERPVRLAAVGHEHPQKDQLLMIELVHLARAAGTPVELTLTIDATSSDDYVRQMVDAVDRHGLRDAVNFAGTVRDVSSLYSSSDVVISASLTESFGFPLLEAMSAGVPVLATSIPASVEVAGDVPWFFRPGDAADALGALHRLLATPTPDLRARVDAGRERAASFSWSRNAESVATVVAEASRARR